MHSLIERSSTKLNIFTPDQWYTIIIIIKTAKRGKTPYIVVEVDQDMIFDLKELVKKQNWEKNTQGVKVPWSCIKEVSSDVTNSGFLQYKLNFDNLPSSLSTKTIGHPLNLKSYQLEKAYKLGIRMLNLMDVKQLCKINPLQNEMEKGPSEFYINNTESQSTKKKTAGQKRTKKNSTKNKKMKNHNKLT